MGRDSEALKILMEIRDERPKEATVYILIGRIYKKLGDKLKALENFNCALDLDPKDIN